MKFTKFTSLLILVLALFSGCRRDHSPWALEIEGKKYSVNDVKSAYNAFFFLMSQQLQATPEQLKEILVHPEKAPRPEVAALIKRELSAEAFLEKYKHLLLLNLEAKEDNYMNKDNLKSKLEFLKAYFIANMYMVDKMQSLGDDISDADVEAKYIEIKRKNPKAIPPHAPLTQVMEMIKQQLKMEGMQKKQGKMINDIVAKHKIKLNDNQDPNKYLSFTKDKADKKADESEKNKEDETKPKKESSDK